MMIIDDFSDPAVATNGARWQLFSDRVMGGITEGTISRGMVSGRNAITMKGRVRLENNGGFLQIAIDLSANGGPIDAGAFDGVEIDVTGNGEAYGCHLRTTDTTRPWQSYRQGFQAPPQWTRIRLPFSKLAAYRIDIPFDPRALRRIGLVAIGREFDAHFSVSRVALYSDNPGTSVAFD